MTEPRTAAGRALLSRQAGHARHGTRGLFTITPSEILAIEAEAAAGVHDEGLHRLLMPPHPGEVYQSSALCSCGEWQYDADSFGALTRTYGDILREHTRHAAGVHLGDEGRSEGSGLDAPSLDEGPLARALHRAYCRDNRPMHSAADHSAAAIAAEYRRLAQEGETQP